MPTKYKNKITLPSDGEPIEVSVLGIWEMDDNVPIDWDEEFTYEMTVVTGETYRAKLDLSRFEEPPPEPDIPLSQVEPKSSEWHDWRNYQTYQAAIAHQQEMVRRQDEWKKRVSLYVIKECLDPKDRKRIADAADHNAVVRAAVTPRVTKENLSDQLRQTFPG